MVIDEAHHAAADTYRRVLEYFRPRFILGLTATANRADGQDLLELFRNWAHRLSLREAVERGELVPIRCVRVATFSKWGLAPAHEPANPCSFKTWGRCLSPF